MSNVRQNYSVKAEKASTCTTSSNTSVESSRCEGNHNLLLLGKTDRANMYNGSKYNDDDDEIAHSRRFK